MPPDQKKTAAQPKKKAPLPLAFAATLVIGLVLVVVWFAGIGPARFSASSRPEPTAQQVEAWDVVPAKDAAEQFVRGRVYYEGKIVPQDKLKAAVWLHRAAEQGNAEAQSLLGLMYAQGDGVPRDTDEAAVWLRKAAAQGMADAKTRLQELDREGAAGGVPDPEPKDAEGQLALGCAYDKGKGVPQDSAKAAVWFRKAAEQGNAEARQQLGRLYDKGRGVPQDKAQAAVWYRKAAEQGNAEARFRLGRLYDDGEGVPQDKEQALALFLQAAEQGNYRAQRYLGFMYIRGDGVPMDRAKGRSWLRKAWENIYRLAEAGDGDAQFAIGRAFYIGIEKRQDINSARYWFTMAAMGGNADAQYMLGEMYQDGDGLPQDRDKALFWFRKSAAQGDEEAREMLTQIERRDAEVRELTRRANNGDADAPYTLAMMYREGDGVPRDRDKAFLWFRMAAERGHAEGALQAAIGYVLHNGFIMQDWVQAYAFLLLHMALRNGEAPTTEAEELKAYLEQGLTSEQQAEARRKAAALKKQAQQSSR